MNKRKQVLMLPSWYPTKDNPIVGSFFKEQALCLATDNDFVVLLVRRTEISRGLLSLLRPPRVELHVELVEETVNYREFVVDDPHDSFGRVASRILRTLKIDLSKRDSERRVAWVEAVARELASGLNVQPDVIYAMTAQVNADLAHRLSGALRVPFIVSEHNPFPLPGTLLSPQIRHAMSSASAVLVVSHDKARQVLMQDIACKPLVIGNLVDESLFLPRTSVARPVKNLVFVAAYNFYKDHETFFRALGYLKTLTSVPFRVSLIGFSLSTQIDDYNYGSKGLMKLIEKFDLRALLDLVPRAARSEMPRYYREADAFVMTSIQEGLPVSALEAAASGLPIFSTRCGGVEDFVDDSIGRLYRVRDSASLAEGLRDFLEGQIMFDAGHIRDRAIAAFGREAFRAKFQRILVSAADEWASQQ